MYYRKDADQLTMEEFYQPFGGRLRKDNRWVRLSEIMPWTHIEEIYAGRMSEETGRPGLSSRIAFGALYIKAHCHLTDEETVENLQENAYMQYFVGLHAFHPEPLFEASMMVNFRIGIYFNFLYPFLDQNIERLILDFFCQLFL